MDKIILGISLLLFLASTGSAIYVRMGLVKYTELLMISFDEMLAGKKKSIASIRMYHNLLESNRTGGL